MKVVRVGGVVKGWDDRFEVASRRAAEDTLAAARSLGRGGVGDSVVDSPLGRLRLGFGASAPVSAPH